MVEQIIEFEYPIKVSLNEIYSSRHWTQRKSHKDMFLWAFMTVASKIRPVESCDLEFLFNFKSHPLDCDNCAYMAKLIIDCLKHYRKIKDDTPQYIRSVKFSSRKGCKNNVIIKIS